MCTLQCSKQQKDNKSHQVFIQDGLTVLLLTRYEQFPPARVSYSIPLICLRGRTVCLCGLIETLW